MRAGLCAATLMATWASASSAHEQLSGHWSRGDGAARVRISSCGSSFCAVNTWVAKAGGGEKVGDRLVMSVSPSSATVLKGTAYDPQRNLTYAIEIRVGERRMTTRGCVLGGLVCKNVGWAKLK